jgi:opacity protein-like surface antigen
MWLVRRPARRDNKEPALRNRLLASVGTVALMLAGPAMAADQAPPAAAAWTWSGFYLGGHAGHGWAQDPFNAPGLSGANIPGFLLTGIDSKGFAGGFQAGANWQTGVWVGGLEIDLSGTGIKGATSAAVGPLAIGPATLTASSRETDKFDWLGSARVRLGYLAWPNVLLYGTGGLAWTRFVQDLDAAEAVTQVGVGSISIAGSVSTPNWLFGWVAGVGGEARLLDTNWLARIEYLHYDFGDSGNSSQIDTTGGVVTLATSTTSGHRTIDVVRGGLSYKFDGNPFVAGSAGAAPGATLYKAPARVAAAWNWSGIYLGGHAGYGWGRDPFNETEFNSTFSLLGVDSKGFVGGFQAGANWQAGAWVGGLEIDLSATGMQGSTSNGGPGTVAGNTNATTQTDTFDRLGSARARLGYLPWPSVLIYGTGGLAWTRFVETTVDTEVTAGGGPTSTNVSSSSTPSWRFGWVAGVGAEARLADSNWLARIEYLHYDFSDEGNFSSIDTTGGVTTFSSNATSGHLTNDVVRAGLSYKFDGGPLVAGFTGAAPAAMLYRAPARVAAAWDWSRFSIGGHAGYGWGRDPFEQSANAANLAAPLSGVDSKGFVGGFQAGANWQAGAWVNGLEVDLSSTGIDGSASNMVTNTPGGGVTNTAGAAQTDKFDLLGSARARLGYLPWPSVLIYGTGGLAWTRFVQTVDTMRVATGGGPTSTSATSDSTPSWQFGWVAGVGSQARLGDTNWLARIEYLHYDFGDSGNFSVIQTMFGVTQSVSTTSGHLTTDVVRAGLDFKFD